MIIDLNFVEKEIRGEGGEMDKEVIKSKKVAELREIARVFGLTGAEKMKKEELVIALIKGLEDDKANEPSTEPKAKKAAVKPSKATVQHEKEKTEDGAKTDAEKSSWNCGAVNKRTRIRNRFSNCRNACQAG